MIVLSFLCDIPWWLLWLLPLLLALLSWFWWSGKYKRMVDDYEGRIKGLNGRISDLETALADCKKRRTEVESDLALTKGRLRELEAENSDLTSSLALAQKSGNSSTAALDTTELDGLKSSLAGANLEIEKLKSDLNKAKADLSSAEAAATASSVASTNAPAADMSGIVSSLTDSGSSDDGDTGISALSAGGAVGGSDSRSGEIPSMYAKVKADNLQIIEGIGPKMESILKENGISTHADLGSKSTSEIQAVLDKYGDRYKIIDPGTWVQQAKLAGDRKFESLIDLQKKLDAGKDNASGMTDSKLEKYLIKIGVLKAFKQDDLTAIEGIGPATNRLLNDNGVTTWRELANTSVDRLKEILESGGSRFSLGDPTTWPKQAQLAADGDFDKLREYQDFLDGGKE